MSPDKELKIHSFEIKTMVNERNNDIKEKSKRVTYAI